MMVPKKSLLLAGAALALCGAATNAQSQSGKVFARYNKPLKSLTLDLGTGTITRGPQVTNRKGNTVTDFDNNDLGGFVGVDTGDGFCLWIDPAVKGTGAGRTAGVVNNSDIMNSIIFAYCSAKLTPGSGGPGGTMALHFYEGYTLFGGAATTSVAHFTLTGLPGNSASSSFFGGFGCFFLRVIFNQLLCFADGPIGYGWTFLDKGYPTANPLSSVLAGTWPFLSCTVSCSADILQYDLQGMTDALDEYCPTTSLRATFTFGTTSGSFTSMSMAIEEVVDQTAQLTTCTGTPANPDVLTATFPVVGNEWTITVKTGLTRTKTGSWTMFVGDTPLGKPAGLLLAQFPKCPEPGGVTAGNFGTSKAGRKLLCNIDCLDPTSCFQVPISAPKGSSSTCVIAIPKRISLVCFPFCAQADVFGGITAGTLGGGNHRLSTSINGIIGTNAP
jgi:outer membrane lipoprotein SlyB